MENGLELLMVAGTMFVLGFFITGTFIQGFAIPAQTQAKPLAAKPAAQGLGQPQGLAEELSLDGYVQIKFEADQEAGVIVMSSGCYSLAAETTDAQLYSISEGLRNETHYRPTTHDVMKDMMDMYGIRPVQGRIDKFEKGLYYGTLVVERGGFFIALDSRPTDVMGIAVRYGLPVYMNESMLRENGANTCTNKAIGG